MRTILVVFMAGLVLCAWAPVEARDNGPSAGQAILSAAFSAAERETIHQYFVRHPDQLQAVDQLDRAAHEGSRQEYREQGDRYREHGDRGDDDRGDDDRGDHDREDEDRGGHGNWHSRDHGRGHGHGHGHGNNWKSRAGGMPPGIAMNFERGKPLPPGIARQMRPLPRALARELPPPPRGYERVEVDGKILLVAIATHVIYDVISDAILGDQHQRQRHR